MKKGFTLIELLVIIAILGILTSVVLARVQSSKAPSSSDNIGKTERWILSHCIGRAESSDDIIKCNKEFGN